MAKDNRPASPPPPSPLAPTPKQKPVIAYRYERRGVSSLAAVEVTMADGKVSERDLWQADIPGVTIGKLERHMTREVGL